MLFPPIFCDLIFGFFFFPNVPFSILKFVYLPFLFEEDARCLFRETLGHSNIGREPPRTALEGAGSSSTPSANWTPDQPRAQLKPSKIAVQIEHSETWDRCV